MPEKVNLNAYFERIGFAGSIAPSVATLELLHALHPACLPFANLGPLLGQAVPLDTESLQRRLLNEKRGGHGFEHNFLFMRLLRELDYTVWPLLARVVFSEAEAIGAPPSHMVLAAEVNGQTFLVDVGFGALTPTAPLRLRAELEQATPHESFRLMGGDPEWRLEILGDGQWRPVYTFSLSEIEESQLVTINEGMVNSTTSPLTQQLRVALSPAGKRLKLLDASFTRSQAQTGESERRQLTNLAQLRETLSGPFGLNLPNADTLDPRLSALLARPDATEA